jgi:hypothetical protein
VRRTADVGAASARGRGGGAEPGGAAVQVVGRAASPHPRVAALVVGVEESLGLVDQQEEGEHRPEERQEEGERQVCEPRTDASGDCGSSMPTAAVESMSISSGRLGRLRVNGNRRVRITKITRVWVARDSANQPPRNSSGPAWNTPSITARVGKVVAVDVVFAGRLHPPPETSPGVTGPDGRGPG